MSVEQKKRWVKIIFLPAMTEKTIPHAERIYVKADCLCVELPDRDDNGDPIIVSYPLMHIFQYSRAHVDHVGAGPRSETDAADGV